MLRASILARCHSYHIKPSARVGIFPLHLDPPTIQHCEIFKLLVGKGRGQAPPTVAQDPAADGPLHPIPTEADVAAAPGGLAALDGLKKSGLMSHYRRQPTGSKELQFGRLKHNMLNDAVSCDAALRRAVALEHFDEFERLLNESSLAPFDHLILVPNTKFPVTLRQSVHLAAMAVLATRDLPRVHVDLKALEHPDEMMPVVYDLVAQFPKSTIIHWLPNVHETQNWKNFDEIAKKVPFLLLRPKGWRSISEAAKETDDREHQGGAAGGGLLSTIGQRVHSKHFPPSSATHYGGGGEARDAVAGASVVSSMTPPQPQASMSFHRIADQKRVRTLMPRQWDMSTSPLEMEIIEVPRMSGSYVRQELWEGSTNPPDLISPAVLRYIDSQTLYRDFRKGAFHSRFSDTVHSARAGKPHVASAQAGLAVVAFEGIIPRLELHYDPNNLLAREQYNKLKTFECLDGRAPDLIVPIGGDGYFMHCVRKNWRRFIPFFGVNAGHVGYLLNDCSYLEDLFSAPLKLHHLSMLYCEAEAENATGEKHSLEELAFNDAWVERATGQTALIRILVNGEERIRRVRGDGVLMSTAAGSTAYAQALGASPVPVGAPLIQLVGSNIVAPLQWRPVHLNQEDCVEFEVVDNFKRPCRGFVDSVDVGIVTRMLVRTSRVAGIQVAFADSCDLQQKLYKMQFPGSH